ncbi:MAG: hypothetical protein K0R39_3699 [Symbiobacteriaceae bacterium]|jgi:hypothetical protein|nr:hypothetical protein [Symbiobacteriaceae bacterium]
MKPEEALEQVAYMRRLVNQSRITMSGFGPYFILWGVLWIVGYLGSLWFPGGVRDYVWPAIYVIGFGASFWPALRRGSGPSVPTPALFKKLSWLSLVLLVGAVALPFIFFQKPEQHTVNAYYPFVIGLIYVAQGIFYGGTIIAIGAWLIVAGVASLWMPWPLQSQFLALAGGGSLIVTGLVLRRQVSRE